MHAAVVQVSCSGLIAGMHAAGVCVMLVLLFITPVFERLPFNAMGAIVLSSVLGLLELSEARFLFKANFLDFLVWMAAFLGTVFLGVEIGLGIAIGLAVVLVVYQSAFPHTAVLGNLPETGEPHTLLIQNYLCQSSGFVAQAVLLTHVTWSPSRGQCAPCAPPGVHVWQLYMWGVRCEVWCCRQETEVCCACRGVPQQEAVSLRQGACSRLHR